MIPLIIAFTPGYFVPAAVTLKSIAQSSAPGTRYGIICLVTEEIPERQKDMLEKTFGEAMTFTYVNLSGRLDGAYVDPRYSEAASYRLLLPELLPEYNTAVYIDCDVIVRNDIAALYSDTRLGNHLLAAVYEAPIEGQAERWKALGCDSHSYFNSGFLIMNLKRMREERTSERLMAALRVDYLEFPDQDALNQVCKGRVMPLPPIYNSIRTFFLPQYREDFLKSYSSDDWEQVQAHGTVHYTGGKPWKLFTVQFGLWWQTYDSLPEQIRDEWHLGMKMRILAALYRNAAGRRLLDALRQFGRSLKAFCKGSPQTMSH